MTRIEKIALLIAARNAFLERADECDEAWEATEIPLFSKRLNRKARHYRAKAEKVEQWQKELEAQR